VQKVATKLKRLYAKGIKKKKDNKKKMSVLLVFFAFCLIIIILAFRLLVINSKIAIISIGKKVNLRCLNKFRLKFLVKKGYCFICKEQDYTSCDCLYKGEIKQFCKTYI